MTAPRNADVLIQAFLEEGVVDLPDRVFDVVRGEIHGTRQRVVLGPIAQPRSQTLARLAIAAALVLAVGVTWLNVGQIVSPGIPTPTPSPTESARPDSTVRIVGTGVDGRLAPGRWAFHWDRAAGADGEVGPAILVTIPSDGWTQYTGFAADKNYGLTDAEAGPSFVVWKIVNRYVNGCTDLTRASPEPGRTVDEILTAVADQPLIEAGPLTDVIVDGYSGKVVELTSPDDFSGCVDGFWPWLGKYAQGPGEVDRVYALDVDGFLLTFFARVTERTTPADLAELESVIASIDIVP